MGGTFYPVSTHEEGGAMHAYLTTVPR